jgi:hypothetical protein
MGLFIVFGPEVALVFGQWQAHIDDEHASIQYVGVLKDILRLDYGASQLQSFSCDVHGFEMKVM